MALGLASLGAAESSRCWHAGWNSVYEFKVALLLLACVATLSLALGMWMQDFRSFVLRNTGCQMHLPCSKNEFNKEKSHSMGYFIVHG